MNKLVLGVVATSILMGVFIVSSKQWKTIESQTASLDKQVKEIEYLNENLDLQVKENLALEEENFLLEEHAGILRDSIMRLNKSYTSLRRKSTKQARYIALIEKKLKQLDQSYQAIQADLNQAATKGQKKEAHIQSMLESQSRLLAEMQILKRKKKKAETMEIQAEPKVASTFSSNEVTPFKKSNLAFNLPGTAVKMLEIELRKKRFSKRLKKIRKGTDWRYTILKINMDHPRLGNLIDKNFKVRLVNQEDGSTLSYVERNPNFPNSSLDSKGIGFTYEGQPIELVYYNNDDKAGENYELRFFHIDDSGNEHLIPGATYQIVKDGKVL